MTKEAFAKQYQSEMACVCVSPQLKRKTLDVMNGKEKPVVKKKLSAALVFALALLLCAVALATASRFGMLDFIGRHTGIDVPHDAQDYVQPDVLHLENELVAVDLRELYYDGLIARMTVDVTPKSKTTMLLGEDMLMEDSWLNMIPFEITLDTIDPRTAMDVYREGGYTAAYSVSAMLRVAGDEAIFGTGDHSLNADGTLTLYHQWEYKSAKPQREATFSLTLFPYTESLDQIDVAGRIDLTQPVTLTEAAYAAETYESTQPVDFPCVGVRVDKLTLELRAQEIHAIIDFTVTDAEAFAAMDEGLWFEFIDPASTAEAPYEQRLSKGLVGGASVTQLNEAKTQYRQRDSLGRSELHAVYTLRAYNAWEKTRYETQSIPVTKK